MLAAIIFTISLGYFLNGLQDISVGAGAVISTSSVSNYYGIDNGLSLNETNQRIAISVIGKNDGMPKFDPKYVRLIADYTDVDENGNEISIKLPLHTCT